MLDRIDERTRYARQAVETVREANRLMDGLAARTGNEDIYAHVAHLRQVAQVYATLATVPTEVPLPAVEP